MSEEIAGRFALPTSKQSPSGWANRGVWLFRCCFLTRFHPHSDPVLSCLKLVQRIYGEGMNVLGVVSE